MTGRCGSCCRRRCHRHLRHHHDDNNTIIMITLTGIMTDIMNITTRAKGSSPEGRRPRWADEQASRLGATA